MKTLLVQKIMRVCGISDEVIDKITEQFAKLFVARTSIDPRDLEPDLTGNENWLEFLIFLRDNWHCLPLSQNQARDQKTNKGTGFKPITNGELIRLMNDGGILFSGKKVNWKEQVEFPITEVVFFPSGVKRTSFGPVHKPTVETA